VRRGLLVAGLALAAAAAWLGCLPRVAPVPVPGAPAAAALPAAAASAPGPAASATLPDELTRRYPPGTHVPFPRPLDPRQFSSGLGCPGGGHLPLLNGVPAARPLHRNTSLHGPVPPVIGKRVDASGDDWYVHADGSETTTRWTTLTVEGIERRDVRTDHLVPARGEHGLGPPPARDR
jgi:hypothetical protein